MAVRVFKLSEQREIEVLAAYGGCKSWLKLADDVPVAGIVPALPDDEYARRVAEVRVALEREPMEAGR